MAASRPRELYGATDTYASKKFNWDPRKERAAMMEAEASMNQYTSVKQMAKSLNVSYNMLCFWRQHPDFRARVEQNKETLRQQSLALPVANKAARIRQINDRWTRLQEVIRQRAASAAQEDPDHLVPGYDTGLLVHTQRAVGSGPNQRIVDEYELDNAVLDELRSLEIQAAREMGQLTEHKRIDITKLTNEQLVVMLTSYVGEQTLPSSTSDLTSSTPAPRLLPGNAGELGNGMVSGMVSGMTPEVQEILCEADPDFIQQVLRQAEEEATWEYDPVLADDALVDVDPLNEDSEEE